MGLKKPKSIQNIKHLLVDLPANSLWQTLRDEFPEAKVILVVRDDQKWINSLQNHLVVSFYFWFIFGPRIFFRKCTRGTTDDVILKVERQQFWEMWFHRCFGPVYRWIFNHSSEAVTMYMDYFR